jgi:hypothetical protein
MSIHLRANREDFTLPDNHGQIWTELITLASGDNSLFRGPFRKVEEQMVNLLGLYGKATFPVRRLGTLWRNPRWRPMITKWCQFPVGQSSFNISVFEYLCSCRVDDVSILFPHCYLIRD